MYINKTSLWRRYLWPCIHSSQLEYGSGTLYLTNSKWQGCNPRLKEVSTSQMKRPTSGSLASPVHSVKARVTGTPDISDGISRILFAQTPTPNPHANNTHFPSYTQYVAFLVGSLALSQSLSVSNYFELYPPLHSPSANFLIQPNHSSSSFPIMQCSP